MKVLLINGSPRKNGNTFTALTEIAHQLNKNGIDTEIVQLGNKPVRGCICCGQCMVKGNGRCAFDDDVCNSITERFDDIDALVLGSPVYYGQPNGALLAVMQRALFAASRKLENKPVANVAICRRGGATAAFQTMNMMFQMVNMPVVTSQYWNIAYGLEEGETAFDSEGMQTMRTLANNMAWLLKKIHADTNIEAPQREEWQPMHFVRPDIK